MWFLERWLESPKTVKKLVYILYASLIISCLLGFVIHLAPPAEHAEHDDHAAPAEHAEHAEHGESVEHEEHASFAFEQIPIFSAIFGFIVCALLGIGAKAYGHNAVMKEEDYYDD